MREEEDISKDKSQEEKAKLEAKIRREVMQLFIEEAKIEAEAKEQRERLLKDKEEEERLREAQGAPISKKDGAIIKIKPEEEQLELNLEALQSRAKLEERIKFEKLKGKRILQGLVASLVIAFLIILGMLNPYKEVAAPYNVNVVKKSLEKSSSYYGQFAVEEVVLSKDRPLATLNLNFVPSDEASLKKFVESTIKKYSLLRPGEKISLILKSDQRIYARVNYSPPANSIEIELMK